MNPEINGIIKKLKKNILKMFYHSRSGHLSSALSCVEILAVLYFIEKKPSDKIFLSKGHGAAALYAVLAEQNILSPRDLESFYGKNSKLLALASPTIDGIEIPTGSLGQGICFAAGVAKAYQMDQKDGYIYCVLGDGEMQEGSVWEAAMVATQQRLHNFIVVLDYNRIQASNNLSSIIDMEPIAKKWKSFGWKVETADGHDPQDIHWAIDSLKHKSGEAPSVVVAYTHKGNGLRGIEDAPNCHMLVPEGDEWKTICKDFDISYEELIESAE